MKSDTLQAGIEHRIAELRAAHPEIGVCHFTLDEWHEDAGPRYALRLDLRRPQHQSLISGPACDSAERAVQAAFDLAARSLGTSHAHP
jgi:hypothetical protein